MDEMVWKGWFSEEELGPELRKKLESSPPTIVIGSAETLVKNNVVVGGGYTRHTNLVLLLDVTDPGVGLYQRVHEITHYVCWLGGGLETIRWREKDGTKRGLMQRQWINEGFADWNAHHLGEKMGSAPVIINYYHEFVFACLLESLAGREAVRTAMYHGEYTAVQRAVDSALGKGTFEEAVSQVRAFDANRVLVLKMEERGMDIEKNARGFLARALIRMREAEEAALRQMEEREGASPQK